MYRIASGVRRTVRNSTITLHSLLFIDALAQHCDKSISMSELCDCNIYLKKDFTQFTGSFKER
jgi:hypothetical protein